MKRMGIVAAIVAPVCLSPIANAQALPLQPGQYRWASYYIQIAKKGDRVCFQGLSGRGSSTSSLLRDAKHPDRYQLQGVKDAVLLVRQDKADQISYGSADNMIAYTAEGQAELKQSLEMQQCLNSQAPYYQQKPFSR